MRLPLSSSALFVALSASAGGLSTDISMQPLSVAVPAIGPISQTQRSNPGSVRVGWAAELTHRPMDQYRCTDTDQAQCDAVSGVVIGERLVAVGGLSAAVTRSTWLDLSVPAAAQWGGDVPGLSSDGVVLGDPRAGLRSRILERQGTLDLYGDVSLPIGTKNAWFSDRLPTAQVGVALTHTTGALTGLLDVSTLLRARAEPNEWDLRSGPALLLDVGGSLGVTDDVDLWAVASSRFTSGDPAAVLYGGAAVGISPELQLDIGVGRAVLKAPGAGPLHVRASFTYTYARPMRPVLPPAVAQQAPVDASEWPPGVEYRLRDGKVEVRQTIAFVPHSARISRRAFTTLLGLAQWMEGHPEVGEVLIAAYAHSESTSASNYTLSLGRAQAVTDALVAAGVARSRLSYKGMGMLTPNQEAGEHLVVVDGQTRAYMTLVLPDAVDMSAEPDGQPFADWLSERSNP